MRASADPVVVESLPRPPLRLRYVLLVGVLSALGLMVAPRLRAAFRLHGAATAFADYALCMVGPTGPSLLRDNPAEFRRLVRRRLIVSGADARPFAKCAKGAQEVTQSLETERAHREVASSFVEYGNEASGAAAAPVRTRLDELAVTTRSLAELAEAGWPFVRGGYTSLVRASAYATEAPHPADLPRPAVGRGALPLRSLTECAASEKGPSFRFTLSADRRVKVVRSMAPEGVRSDAALAPADARVFAASCDDRVLVAAVGREGSRDVSLFTCTYLQSCVPLPLPTFGPNGPVPRYPLDIARVNGVTVLVSIGRGIVRAASTRDDGRSWTPFTVAFDAEAQPDLRFDTKMPDHLHIEGSRLALYAAPSRRNATFPLLVSDDSGASFHAP